MKKLLLVNNDQSVEFVEGSKSYGIKIQRVDNVWYAHVSVDGSVVSSNVLAPFSNLLKYVEGNVLWLGLYDPKIDDFNRNPTDFQVEDIDLSQYVLLYSTQSDPENVKAFFEDIGQHRAEYYV